MPVSFNDSLAVFGNSNHLSNFIKKYEDAIDLGSEIRNDFSEAPNYYAWLITTSEQIYYLICGVIYVNTNDHKVFNWGYKTLLDRFLKDHKMTVEEVECVLLFAKLRHLIVHKGFPNPHIAPLEDVREIAAGYRFCDREVKSLAEKYHSPKNFPELRNCYLKAAKAIEGCKNDFVHDFGLIRISRKKR